MNNPTQNKSFNRAQYAKVSSQVKVAQSNLFLVAIFTAVNVLLVSFGSTSYFLFSASIPYYIAMMGSIFCGLMPDSYYAEAGIATEDLLPLPVFFALLAIALIMIGAYVLCGFLAKKYVGGFIAALVLFSIDTVAMFLLFGISFDMILDILFHIWVLVYLVMGTVQSIKYRKLSKEAVVAAVEQQEMLDQMDPAERYTSPALRDADTTVKQRVLVEATVDGHHISFVHKKNLDELVVDGKVYAEISFNFLTGQGPHALMATVDGHEIVASNNASNCTIHVDGVQVASKIRWY